MFRIFLDLIFFHIGFLIVLLVHKYLFLLESNQYILLLAICFYWNNTSIINAYMQFIYSTLEYYIMPIVNIGIELRDRVPNWSFGKNVISSIEACKSRYYTKTYGDLDVDNLELIKSFNFLYTLYKSRHFN